MTDPIAFVQTLRKRRLFQRSGQERQDVENASLFVASDLEGSSTAFKRHRDLDNLTQLRNGEVLVGVQEAVFALDLNFPNLADHDGVPLDFKLCAMVQISNPLSFLRDYAFPRLQTRKVLSRDSIESLVLKFIRVKVVDKISTKTFQELTAMDALPAHWWHSFLLENLKLDWLRLTSDFPKLSYRSTQADARAELNQKKKLDQLERQALLDRRRFESEQALEQLRHEGELAQLRRKTETKDRERARKIELAELEHQNRVLAAKEQAVLITLKREKEQAELEAEIAQKASEKKQVELHSEQTKAVFDEISETLQQVQNARAELEKIADVMQEANKSGVAAGRRLADHVVGVSTATNELLGDDEPHRDVVAMLREAERACGGVVRLIKQDIASRDLGTRSVNAVAIGADLSFTLNSKRDGYVTLLNVGTSGRIYLLCPNGVIGVQSAKVMANQSLAIPGPELLPGFPLIENGPSGWEEMLAIISDFPVLDDQLLRHASPIEPVVSLSRANIRALGRTLRENPQQTWSVGVMGFVVE